MFSSSKIVAAVALVAPMVVAAPGGLLRRGVLRNHVNRVLHELGARANAATKTLYYEEAILDHFDDAVGATPTYWRQRYYVDPTFFGGPGSPIFLEIGGEGPQGPPSTSMFSATLAEKHGALLVSVEHRFYGESRPVPNMTLENLRYLTSDQALADLARFVDFFKATYTTDLSSSPLVVFGGSYPGALAAWFKLKYPAHAVGAIASSAPVFAVFDFYQYAQVVGAALSAEEIGGSAECLRVIQDGATALAALVESTTPMGSAAEIPDALAPCTPMTSKDDLAYYYAEIYSTLEGTVQYNLEGSSPTVGDVCAAALAEDDDLSGLAAATSLVYASALARDDDNDKKHPAAAKALFKNTKASCVESSLQDDYIAGLADVSFDSGSMRAWIWQSCNQFGYFQSTFSPDATTPFSAFQANDAASAGLAVCRGGFGLPDYSGPRDDGAGGLAANANYGARHFSNANVTFVNGNLDPWHSLGIVNTTDAFYEAGGATQVLAPGVSVIELAGTAHCRDMYAPGALEAAGVNDTASVAWAHQRVAADVARYLS